VSASCTEKPVATVHPPHAGRIVEPRRAEEESRAPAPGRRRPWLGIAVLAAAAIAGAAYGYHWFAASGKAPAGESPSHAAKAALGFVAGSPAGGRPESASPVETVPVEVVRQSRALRVTGTLIADEKSSVVSNVSGIVAEVRVDRGSFVRKDDVLVQIDPTDARQKLAEGQAMVEELKVRLGLDSSSGPFVPENQPEVKLARAALELATSNYERARDLFAKKVFSAESYDATRTERELAVQRHNQALHQVRQSYQAYKTALTRLAILEKAVADTTIRAPFDGWVAEKLVSVGEQVSAGMQATKVVTLVRIDPMRLSLTVPQQDIGLIQAGQTVRFQVDSFPDRTFEGKLQFISPVVTADTRSLVAEALVPNPQGELRPGLFATAEVQLPQEKAEVLVPVGAVQRLDEVAKVFVVRDGVAREQVVSLGETAGGKVEVTSGLSGKELLVARPGQVRDGDVVNR